MNFDDIDLYDDEDVSIDDTYLIFSVNSENYAVCVKNVTEIVRLQKIIKIPDVPDYVVGVINLRGKVIPVIDMKIRFGIKNNEYSDRTVIIVLELDNVLTGITVDSVNEVTEILPGNIEPPPQYGADNASISVIEGMGKNEKFVCIILNISNLINKEKINLPELKEAFA